MGSSVDDTARAIAEGKQRRVRRRTLAALTVMAIAIVVAVLTVVLDWGWGAWIAALVTAAIALLVASLRHQPVLRGAAVVAAVVLVGAGVLVVRIPPITSAGWELEPAARLIGATDTIAVTLAPATGEVQGRAITDGRSLWNTSVGGSGRVEAMQLGTDAVLLFTDSGSSMRDNLAAVVSITDGKLRWNQPVGQQRPFANNDGVVVFAGDKTTTGIDLQTGKSLWRYAGEATAGSGGRSSYDLGRWISRADWIAVSDPAGSKPVAVLDVRTGRVAAKIGPAGNDFVIAGKTFVEFGYLKNGRRLAKGTPLAGGRSWQVGFGRSASQEVLDVVDGQARALYDARAVYLNADTGELREVSFEDRWSVNWRDSNVGGRHVAVLQRDRDRQIADRAVVDAATGKLVELPGRGHRTALEIEHFSGGTAIAHATIVDAVGGESHRYARITDGAEHGEVATTEGNFAVAGDVVQVGRRIVALGND
ncbi:outer membrane protein assembly factor BamB family protein [Kribbella deserti]|uniref:PQQ-binding-like beta-propeller repeat protein n=1 Tax=Kribbella deserti TaxID=1926257 RepID=A0ABV6QEP9_9ACTN